MKTVLHKIRDCCNTKLDATCGIWLDSNGKEIAKLSFRERWDSVVRCALFLKSMSIKKGDRVLLLFDHCVEFDAAFLGCALLGAIPVPNYPPNPYKLKQSIAKLDLVITDCSASICLVSPTIMSYLRLGRANIRIPLVSSDDFQAFRTIDPVERCQLVDGFMSAIDGDDLLFLQYTSGSTGNPKGVMITHSQMFHQCVEISLSFHFADKNTETFVTWLPVYHDYGLVSNLSTLCGGGLGVYISPFNFVQNPLLWIQTLSKYNAEYTHSPNFGLRLVVKALKKTPNLINSINLSHLKLLGCGAEPIQPQTCVDFVSMLKPSGLRADCIVAGYGQAEHVLCICQRRVDASSLDSLHLSSSQTPVQGLMPVGYAQQPSFFVDVRIVDPSTLWECSSGQIGEIWVNSPCCRNGGYLNKPEINKETFGAEISSMPGRKYLRTGDLGFVDSESILYICGRLKDIIILNGENVYPQDLEYVVEEVGTNFIRAGCVAVVRTTRFTAEGGMEEGVDVVAEVKSTQCPHSTYARVSEDLCKAISMSGVIVFNLLFIPPRTIPKTSSGKIQRSQCRDRILSKDFTIIHHRERVQRSEDNENQSPTGITITIPTCRLEVFESTIQLLRKNGNLGVEDQLSRDAIKDLSLESLGFDSLSIAALCQLFAEAFRIDISPSEVYSCRSVDELVAALCAKLFLITTAAGSGDDSSGENYTVKSHLDVNVREESDNGLTNSTRQDLVVPIFRIFVFAMSQLVGLFTMLWFFSAMFTPCYIFLENFIDRDSSLFLIGIMRFNVKPTLGSGDAIVLSPREANRDFFSIPYWDAPSATSEPWITNVYVGTAIGSTLVGQVFVLMSAMLAIIIKWTVVGKVSVGSHPRWGVYHFRLWFVSLFVDTSSGLLSFFYPDSLILAAFNRLLGTNVSFTGGVDVENVGQISSLAWDVVTVGDGAKLSSSATLLPVVMRGGHIIIDYIVIGPQSDLRDGSVVRGGCKLPAHTVLPEMCVYQPGDPSLQQAVCESRGFGIAGIVYGIAWWVSNFVLTALCIAVGVRILLSIENADVPFAGMVALFLLSPVSFIMAWAAVTWLMKFLLLRLHPSQVWSGLFWLTVRKVYLRMYGVLDRTIWRFLWGTGFNTLWLKSLGARIGHDSMLSMGVGIDDPECVSIGRKCVFGGGCIMRTAESAASGETIVQALSVDDFSLISQKTILAVGSDIGKHCKVLPHAFAKVLPNCSLQGGLGKPPRGVEYHSYSPLPNLHLEMWGCVIHVVMAVWILGQLFLTIAAAVATSYFLGDTKAPASLQLPAAIFVFIVTSLVSVAIAKWILVWKRKAGDCLVIHETVRSKLQCVGFYVSTTLYNNLTPMLGWWMLSGPWFVLYLRSLGAKVELSASIGTFWIYDWDLLEIGEFAIVESNATLSPHLMNSIRDIDFDRIVLDKGCIVEPNALVLGGSYVREGVIVAANSRALVSLNTGTGASVRSKQKQNKKGEGAVGTLVTESTPLLGNQAEQAEIDISERLRDFPYRQV